MSTHNYHQIECQQDRRRKEKSGVAEQSITHWLCVLFHADMMIAEAKRSFISSERALCVLYSAPMLDLIETWAAAVQQYLNLTDSSWNWSLVMSDAAISSCCPQIGCNVETRLQHHYQTFNHQSLNDMRPWHWDDVRQRQTGTEGRSGLGVVLFIVCQSGVLLSVEINYVVLNVLYQASVFGNIFCVLREGALRSLICWYLASGWRQGASLCQHYSPLFCLLFDE